MEVYLIPKMKTLQFKYQKLSFLPSSHCQPKKLQFKYLIFLPGKSLCSHGWRRRDLKMQSSERLSDWRVKEDTQESRCEIVKMKERRQESGQATASARPQKSMKERLAIGDWKRRGSTDDGETLRCRGETEEWRPTTERGEGRLATARPQGSKCEIVKMKLSFCF